MRGKPHTVSEVMTHAVAAVGRDAPFKDVVTLTEQRKVSAVPVVEGDGRVIGVVSEADLLRKEELRCRGLTGSRRLRRRSCELTSRHPAT